MSAAPDIRPHSLESAWEAAVQRLEEDEHIIRGLRKQNERLAAEKLNAELEASVKVATLKGQNSDLAARVAALEKSVAALDKAQDRTGNLLQPLVGLREEFDRLKSEHYALSGRVSV